MSLDVMGQSITFNSVDRGPERMVLNVYKGRPGFTIFSGNGNARLISKTFNLDALCMFKRDLKMVRDGQPGTTRTLIFQKWIPEEKKYNTDSSLIIGKDDKNVYYLEVQFQSNGNHKSIRFNMRAVNSVTSSTDESTPSISSSIRMDATICWVEDHVPFLMNATAEPYQRNNAPGGGSAPTAKQEYSGADASF